MTRQALLTGLALAQFLFCGCRTAAPLSFGLFSVPTQELGLAKKLGADFVVGPQTQEYIEAARKANLKVLATGDVKIRTDTISGYYLTDEPDLQGIPPDRIQTEYLLAKKATHKPTFLNLSSAHSIEPFQKSCDVVMFDWYPVGWQPVETFYSQLRIARLAAKEKPFYAIVQSFSWEDYPKLMPPKSTHRLPTQDEVLAMTTWAAMGGASGIVFYPGKNSMAGATNISSMIEKAIRFVRSNEKALRGSRVWTDYPFMVRNDDDKYNAVYEASIAVKVTAPGQATRDIFLIAANTTQKTIEVELRPGFEEWAGEKRYLFSPLEVKVLKLRTGGNLAPRVSKQ